MNKYLLKVTKIVYKWTLLTLIEKTETCQCKNAENSKFIDFDSDQLRMKMDAIEEKNV